MRFSQIGEKEIVNLSNGTRLGVIGDSDLLIDERTGKILALLIPDQRGIFNFFAPEQSMEIPWHAIKRIGNDMMIIELDDRHIKG